MSGMNRRKFLKSSAYGVPGSVLTVGALEQLMFSLVEGLFSKAYAEVSGHQPRNYVHLHFDAAPNRVTFDQVLLPTADERANGRFFAQPYIGTAFTRDSSGAITGIEYRTHNVNGVEMPWIWKFDVATSSGGRRPASDLLKNFAVIRGINSGIDGHEFNRERITYPEPSGVSLSGGVADKSTAPMAAVASSGVSWFRSALGLAPSVVGRGSNNSISDLRRAFDYTSLASNVPLTKKAQYEDVIARASDAVKYLVRGSGAKSSLLKGNLDRADAIIKSAAEDLSALWNSGMVRYNNVIQNSVNPSILYPSGIPGLTDQAVLSDGPSAGSKFRLNTSMGIIYAPQGTDLRAMLAPRSATQLQTVSLVAQTFVLSEYVLTRGLSNVATMFMSSSPLSNLNLPTGSIAGPGDNVPLTGTEPTVSGVASVISDEHSTGPYASMLTHTMMYRGLIAAIMEFTEVLKRTSSPSGGNLFDNTVLQITGDFSRSPRIDGTGSDHGYWGSVTSVFSGAFNNGPVVAGNILAQDRGPRGSQSKDNLNTDGSPLATSNGTYNQYPGTWGGAGRVQFGSLSEQLGLKHVAASLSTLLKIDPNPWPFNNQIWSVDGTTLRAVSAKNLKDDER